MNTIVVLSLFFATTIVAQTSTCFHGVNLAGLDFGGGKYPGQYGKDYIAPNNGEIDYYTGKGMNAFRLPFLWERLQPTANGPFNQTYLGYITSVVNYATSKGAKLILDPHNYARYFGIVIGTGNVATSDYANFWSQLAKLFAQNNNVIFGLMNEPNTMSTELWLTDANAAISAIRSVGANNLIIVPGNAWTGAWSWYQNWYGSPNAEIMTGVKDSANNYAIEVHQYLDSDSSGTHDECVDASIGSSRLANFTSWARQNHVKAFLGEWAGGKNSVCYSAITDTLNFLGNNKDVYLGWTWWAGGPWWGNYMFNLDPQNGQDAPQMQYLVPYLKSGC